MMELRYEIVGPTHRDYNRAKSLFLHAFPPQERPPFEALFSWKDKGLTEFLNIYDGQTFLGFVHLVHYKDLLYLFFFALNEENRNKGYGSKILRELRDRYEGNRLYLLAEEVNPKYEDNANRKRREAFYTRNGLINSRALIVEYGVPYELYYAGQEVSKKEHFALMRELLGEKAFSIYYKNVE
ncbi:MAG: GNAT family N-acetyltransferase [Bacilli bacterium]|nr:GNAT family N-acetyltransferase [Bacilli bacterium]